MSLKKIIEEQAKRSEQLRISLEVAKVADAPEVQDLMSDLENLLIKAESLSTKRKRLREEKTQLWQEVVGFKKRFNEEACRMETVYLQLFDKLNSKESNKPIEPFNQFAEKDQRYTYNRGKEVSPCPAEWEAGALDTPRSLLASQSNSYYTDESQILYITFLAPSELASVPKYMKGRMTLENINCFVETLNCLVNNKYAILNLRRKDVKRKDVRQYSIWKCEEEEHMMKGKMYLTVQDLIILGKVKMDKTTEKIIQILRHTRRLKQFVCGKMTLYQLL